MANRQARDDDGGSRLPALAALVVLAVLAVAALWLVGALKSSTDLQDCLLSGRRDCAAIAAPTR